MGIGFELYQELSQYIQREAALLDEGKFNEWLELLSADATYWIPSQVAQTDALGTPSIIYEDKPLLTLRTQRLQHPRAYAAQPAPRTLHVMGNPQIEQVELGWFTTSNMIVFEYQAGESRTFAGVCRHQIRREGGTLMIGSKRIDLIDCDRLHVRPISSLL